MKGVKGLLIVLVCLLMTLSGHPAFSAPRTTRDSLRCPGSARLVYVGDTKSVVLDKCGQPTSVERTSRVPGYYYRDPAEMGHEEYREYLAQGAVPGEEWTYNFGPSQFVYYLRFQSGQLVRIESGGYGY